MGVGGKSADLRLDFVSENQSQNRVYPLGGSFIKQQSDYNHKARRSPDVTADRFRLCSQDDQDDPT